MSLRRASQRRGSALRAVWLAAAVALGPALAGCGSASSVVGPCPPEVRCSGGATLRLAGEIAPLQSATQAPQEVLGLDFVSASTTEVRLQRPVLVTGHVVDDLGKAVPSQVIATRLSLLSGRPNVVAQAPTADDGSFKLPPLVTGTYQFRVVPAVPADAQYAPVLSTLTVTPDQAPLTLRVRSGVALYGRVLPPDQVDRGIPNVHVRAVDPVSGDTISSTAVTDAAGAFTLRLAAWAESMQKIRVVADIDDGKDEPVWLTISRDLCGPFTTTLMPPRIDLREPALPFAARFYLTVKGQSPSGATAPVPGVNVRFSTELSAGNAKDCTSDATAATFTIARDTDATGLLTIPLIPGAALTRSYLVTVVPPSQSLFANSTTTESVSMVGGHLGGVTLELRPALSGRVVGPSGAPLAGVTVSPLPREGLSDVNGVFRAPPAGIVTGDDGAFRIPVEPGAYDVSVVPSPTLPLGAWSVASLVTKGDMDLGAIRLPQSVAAGAVVVDADGAIVPGVELRLYQLDTAKAGTDCAKLPAGCASHLRGDGTTGADGRFKLYLASP